MGFKDYCITAAKELEQVFDKMDENAVERLLDQLIGAKRIFLIGGGREGLVTRAFAMRLAHMGKEAYWIWADTTPAIGRNDVLLIATSSCTGGVLTHVVKSAKEHGAHISLITADDSGPVGPYADSKLFIPAQGYLAAGDLVQSEQPMGNLFEQSMYITLDVVAMLLSRKLGQSYEEMEKRHRNVE